MSAEHRAGRPLPPLGADPRQLAIAGAGVTYRERLLAVERERYADRWLYAFGRVDAKAPKRRAAKMAARAR